MKNAATETTPIMSRRQAWQKSKPKNHIFSPSSAAIRAFALPHCLFRIMSRRQACHNTKLQIMNFPLFCSYLNISLPLSLHHQTPFVFLLHPCRFHQLHWGMEKDLPLSRTTKKAKPAAMKNALKK